MKKLIEINSVFALVVFLFAGCSGSVNNKETKPIPTIKIAYTENSAYVDEDLSLEILFENYETTPKTVGIFSAENNENIASNLSINDNKITIRFTKSYYGKTITFYAKESDIESNQISLKFDGYCVDSSNLETFMNSVENQEIIKLRVKGEYETFKTQTSLFRNQNKKISLDLSKMTITSTDENLFELCLGLESIILPDMLNTISNNTFYRCEKLKNIKLPDSVTTIGEYAFESCYELQNIKLPSSLTSLGKFAFCLCTQFTKIDNIPSGITVIPEGCFFSCMRVSEINLPTTIQIIEEKAFFDTFRVNITPENQSIIIPDSITTIGKEGFGFMKDPSNLKNVYFMNKKGWNAGTKNISEEDLSDPSNAATLLTITERNVVWTHSEQ